MPCCTRLKCVNWVNFGFNHFSAILYLIYVCICLVFNHYSTFGKWVTEEEK